MRYYKTVTKTQVAAAYGVSANTLRRWLRMLYPKLTPAEKDTLEHYKGKNLLRPDSTALLVSKWGTPETPDILYTEKD
jgi:hypothetical protein